MRHARQRLVSIRRESWSVWGQRSTSMAREHNQPLIALASAVRGCVDRVTGHRRGRLDASDAATGAYLTPRPGRRLVSAVLAGTLLNPLNSSMIAVVLALIQADFRISVATA